MVTSYFHVLLLLRNGDNMLATGLFWRRGNIYERIQIAKLAKDNNFKPEVRSVLAL